MSYIKVIYESWENDIFKQLVPIFYIFYISNLDKLKRYVSHNKTIYDQPR